MFDWDVKHQHKQNKLPVIYTDSEQDFLNMEFIFRYEIWELQGQN